MNVKGRWVLVTGASGGLGMEMSRVLARDHGANLVLVARRADVLNTLRDELVAAHKVEVKVIAADLTDEAQAAKLAEQVIAEVPLYAAVLNAAVTHFGHHDELGWDEFKRMLSLNVLSTVRVCTTLLPYLEKRAEQGGILIVSSMTGLAPTPYQTAYSATKAFLVNYGAGLHHEMWLRGVSVSTFAPGGIATDMTAGPRFNELRGWLMPVDVCAKAGVKALLQRHYISVPGFVYQVGALFTRYLPQRFFAGQLATRYRKSLQAHTTKQ